MIVHTARDGKDESRRGGYFRMDHLDLSLAYEQTYHVRPSFTPALRTPPKNHVPATRSKVSELKALIQYHGWANPLAISFDKFNQYKTDHRGDLIRP